MCPLKGSKDHYWSSFNTVDDTTTEKPRGHRGSSLGRDHVNDLLAMGVSIKVSLAHFAKLNGPCGHGE